MVEATEAMDTAFRGRQELTNEVHKLEKRLANADEKLGEVGKQVKQMKKGLAQVTR